MNTLSYQSAETAVLLQPEYNIFLAVVSYLLATLAGYTVSVINELLMNLSSLNGKSKTTIKLLSSGVLAFGIWSMHFVGMSALTFPTPITYEITLSILSFLPALICAIGVVHFLTLPIVSQTQSVLYSLSLALGICSMHVIGMHGMNIDAVMIHYPSLSLAAFLAAWGLSYVTLKVQKAAYPCLNQFSKHQIAVIGAFSFGGAVSAMHYLALQSSAFFQFEQTRHNTGVSIDFHSIVASGLSIFVFSGLVLLLKLKRESLQLNKRTSSVYLQVSDTLEYLLEPSILVDNEDKIVYINGLFYQSFPKLNRINVEQTFIATLLAEFEQHYALINDLVVEKQDSVNTFRTKDGKYWVCRHRLLPNSNAIYTWTDVTQEFDIIDTRLAEKSEALVQAEDLRLKAQKTSEISRLKTLNRMMCSFFHEFNTPIGIMTTAQTSLSEDSESIIELIEKNKLTKAALKAFFTRLSIHDNLIQSNLNKTVRTLEKLKELPQDNFDVAEQECNLLALLNTTFDSFRCLYGQCSPQITVNCSPSFAIKLGKHKFIEVFRHLYENAIIHGGKVADKLVLLVDATQLESSLVITFSDNGNGIQNLTHQDIFEPFVSSKAFEGHLGLGLYTARFITRHYLKGELELDNSEESGCRFRLTFTAGHNTQTGV